MCDASAHLAEFAGATAKKVVRGSAGTAETATAVQAAATTAKTAAHRAGNAGAAALEAAATDSKCGGDVPWRTYATCVCLVLAFAIQDNMASVATGLLAGYLAGSSTAAQQHSSSRCRCRCRGSQGSSLSSSEEAAERAMVTAVWCLGQPLRQQGLTWLAVQMVSLALSCLILSQRVP